MVKLVFEIIMRILNGDRDVSLQLFSFIKGTLYNSRRGTVVNGSEVLDVADVDEGILSTGSYNIVTTIIAGEALTVSANTITKDNEVVIALELISSIVENIGEIESRLRNVVLNESVVIGSLLCSVISDDGLLLSCNDSVLDYLCCKVSDN
jgi:hypothetical protein